MSLYAAQQSSLLAKRKNYYFRLTDVECMRTIQQLNLNCFGLVPAQHPQKETRSDRSLALIWFEVHLTAQVNHHINIQK
jgi:hypothetical protein